MRGTAWIGRLVVVGVLGTGLPLVASAPALAAKPPTTVSIADATLIEGDASAANMSFRISASGARYSGSLTVQYATADGTATAGADYTATSGTASLPSNGCRCVNVQVPVLGDVVTEGSETFVVDLSNPSKGTIADGQAAGTIYDNEGSPGLVALDGAANETAATVDVPVSLTGPSASIVTVAYATVDGTAAAGLDYVTAGGVLTFAPGETVKTVPVAIVPDVFDEDDESFQLVLSAPVNAAIVDGTGVGTILDDDDAPAAWIDDVSVTEGDAATTALTFTVSLEYVHVADVTVDFATVDDTATAGVDYQVASGTLTIPAGNASATLDVTLNGDTEYEGDETFTVALSNPVDLGLADDLAVGTILNDDDAPTALTAKAVKKATKVKVTGRLEIAGVSLPLTVSLEKKKRTSWLPVASKNVVVGALGDADVDGLADAKYVAGFKRPARGTYRFVVSFLGATGFDPCSKTVSFKV